MDSFKSDITVTPTVTCRPSSVTKGQPHEIGIFSKSKTTSMTSLSSERPRKLKPDRPKLFYGHSSEVQSPILTEINRYIVVEPIEGKIGD